MSNPIHFTKVILKDSFFAPRQQVNREVTIPSQLEILHKTGRITAFDHIGHWNPKDFFTPHRFWDSDVAKWAEAASYSIHTHYNKQLDDALDNIAATLARSQMADGYVNSHYQSIGVHKRLTNLTHAHELYCAGHLLEAAVAHKQATGKDNLLKVMRKYMVFVDDKIRGSKRLGRAYDGHQEIELALVRLFKLDGNKRWLNLAKHFIDVRGQGRSALGHNPGHELLHDWDREARARGENPKDYWAKTYAYAQAHAPVREQTEIVGHAVRAVYMFTAVSDLAELTGDAALLAAAERVWDHMVARRTYVTGGLGVAAANEGFTHDYDLPNENAYAETCASIGAVYWAQRMLNITGNGKYADMIELQLYNNIPAGISLDGTQYFYENPLASNGSHVRQDWFDCACCPPNVARLFASLGNYIASADESGIQVHLYAASQVTVADHGLELELSGNYPWDGRIKLKLALTASKKFELRLRIPAWCAGHAVSVNGKRIPAAQLPVKDGYVSIEREWSTDDVVALNLPMPVRTVHANPMVKADAGKVALQRGPIVYCLEACDNVGNELHRVRLKPDQPISAVHDTDLLGGVTALRVPAFVDRNDGWGADLYRATPAKADEVEVTAVPYAVWCNRQPGAMQVWVRA